MIAFDLNQNDSEALLHHVDEFRPQSGETRTDARLRNALLELRTALVSHLEEHEALATPEPGRKN